MSLVKNLVTIRKQVTKQGKEAIVDTDEELKSRSARESDSSLSTSHECKLQIEASSCLSAFLVVRIQPVTITGLKQTAA